MAPVRPVCFMVMPFGRNASQAEPGKGPSRERLQLRTLRYPLPTGAVNEERRELVGWSLVTSGPTSAARVGSRSSVGRRGRAADKRGSALRLRIRELAAAGRMDRESQARASALSARRFAAPDAGAAPEAHRARWMKAGGDSSHSSSTARSGPGKVRGGPLGWPARIRTVRPSPSVMHAARAHAVSNRLSHIDDSRPRSEPTDTLIPA